jgi:hypothetical protein
MDRPFNWFSKTHLRHAREGKYRDVWHLNRYYNPAMDRFVRKSGGRTKMGESLQDLYRSTYADGRLTAPRGYLFDVGQAKLVPLRPKKKGEIIHDGLLYRGRTMMEEFLPRSLPQAPIRAPASGRITIQAEFYGHRHPGLGPENPNSQFTRLAVFGRPVQRIGSHGSNDALMGGEQVVLRALWKVTIDVDSADFAAFHRRPQPNRLYLLNEDDFLHFFNLMKKDGIIKDPSPFKLIKILAVSEVPDEEAEAGENVLMD